MSGERRQEDMPKEAEQQSVVDESAIAAERKEEEKIEKEISELEQKIQDQRNKMISDIRSNGGTGDEATIAIGKAEAALKAKQIELGKARENLQKLGFSKINEVFRAMATGEPVQRASTTSSLPPLPSPPPVSRFFAPPLLSKIKEELDTIEQKVPVQVNTSVTSVDNKAEMSLEEKKAAIAIEREKEEKIEKEISELEQKIQDQRNKMISDIRSNGGTGDEATIAIGKAEAALKAKQIELGKARENLQNLGFSKINEAFRAMVEQIQRASTTSSLPLPPSPPPLSRFSPPPHLSKIKEALDTVEQKTPAPMNTSTVSAPVSVPQAPPPSLSNINKDDTNTLTTQVSTPAAITPTLETITPPKVEVNQQTIAQEVSAQEPLESTEQKQVGELASVAKSLQESLSADLTLSWCNVRLTTEGELQAETNFSSSPTLAIAPIEGGKFKCSISFMPETRENPLVIEGPEIKTAEDLESHKDKFLMIISEQLIENEQKKVLDFNKKFDPVKNDLLKLRNKKLLDLNGKYGIAEKDLLKTKKTIGKKIKKLEKKPESDRTPEEKLTLVTEKQKSMEMYSFGKTDSLLGRLNNMRYQVKKTKDLSAAHLRSDHRADLFKKVGKKAGILYEKRGIYEKSGVYWQVISNYNKRAARISETVRYRAESVKEQIEELKKEGNSEVKAEKSSKLAAKIDGFKAEHERFKLLLEAMERLELSLDSMKSLELSLDSMKSATKSKKISGVRKQLEQFDEYIKQNHNTITASASVSAPEPVASIPKEKVKLSKEEGMKNDIAGTLLTDYVSSLKKSFETRCAISSMSIKGEEKLDSDKIKKIFEEAKNDGRPIIIKRGEGESQEFSIYGEKDGRWQVTPLTMDTEEERAAIQKLKFGEKPAITEREQVDSGILEVIKRGLNLNSIQQMNVNYGARAANLYTNQETNEWANWDKMAKQCFNPDGSWSKEGEALLLSAGKYNRTNNLNELYFKGSQLTTRDKVFLYCCHFPAGVEGLSHVMERTANIQASLTGFSTEQKTAFTQEVSLIYDQIQLQVLRELSKSKTGGAIPTVQDYQAMMTFLSSPEGQEKRNEIVSNARKEVTFSLGLTSLNAELRNYQGEITGKPSPAHEEKAVMVQKTRQALDNYLDSNHDNYRKLEVLHQAVRAIGEQDLARKAGVKNKGWGATFKAKLGIASRFTAQLQALDTLVIERGKEAGVTLSALPVSEKRKVSVPVPALETITLPKVETGTAPTPKSSTAPTPKSSTAPTPKSSTAPTPKSSTAPTPESSTAPTPKSSTTPIVETSPKAVYPPVEKKPGRAVQEKIKLIEKQLNALKQKRAVNHRGYAISQNPQQSLLQRSGQPGPAKQMGSQESEISKMQNAVSSILETYIKKIDYYYLNNQDAKQEESGNKVTLCEKLIELKKSLSAGDKTVSEVAGEAKKALDTFAANVGKGSVKGFTKGSRASMDIRDDYLASKDPGRLGALQSPPKHETSSSHKMK